MGWFSKALDQQGFIFLDLGQSFLDQLIERLIVPPLTFFEVEIEVLLDVVEFAQATFGKTPEGLDPVDEPPLECEILALVDPEILVVTDVDQAIGAFPYIRVHDAFGIHTSPDDVLKRLG